MNSTCERLDTERREVLEVKMTSCWLVVIQRHCSTYEWLGGQNEGFFSSKFQGEFNAVFWTSPLQHYTWSRGLGSPVFKSAIQRDSESGHPSNRTWPASWYQILSFLILKNHARFFEVTEWRLTLRATHICEKFEIIKSIFAVQHGMTPNN